MGSGRNEQATWTCAAGSGTTGTAPARSGRVLVRLPSPIKVLAVGADRRVAAGTEDSVHVLDPKDGQKLFVVSRPNLAVRSVSFSPDRQLLLVGGEEAKHVSGEIWDHFALIHDARTGAKVHDRTISLMSRWLGTAFSGDGQHILSISMHRQFSLAAIETQSGKYDANWLPAGPNQNLHQLLFGDVGPVYFLAVSPQGRRLAFLGESKLSIWDATLGKEVNRLAIPNGTTIAPPVFRPDGKQMAVAQVATNRRRDDVRIWDLANNKEVWLLAGHTRHIRALAYSPDGNYLATAGEDLVVRVWDLKTGQEGRLFRGHTTTVNALAFSADGTTLVSGGADGSVRLWEVRQDQEIVDGAAAARLRTEDDGGDRFQVVHPFLSPTITLRAVSGAGGADRDG